MLCGNDIFDFILGAKMFFNEALVTRKECRFQLSPRKSEFNTFSFYVVSSFTHVLIFYYLSQDIQTLYRTSLVMSFNDNLVKQVSHFLLQEQEENKKASEHHEREKTKRRSAANKKNNSKTRNQCQTTNWDEIARKRYALAAIHDTGRGGGGNTRKKWINIVLYICIGDRSGNGKGQLCRSRRDVRFNKNKSIIEKVDEGRKILRRRENKIS